MGSEYIIYNMAYGPDHTQAKKNALQRKGERCEITGEKSDLQAHHVSPKYLGGPNNEYNYQILEAEYHRTLHEDTASDYVGLLRRRKLLYGKVIRQPDNEKLREELVAIDEVLIAEYVHKLINNTQEEYREKLVESTMNSNFHTINDLNITIEQLRLQIKEATKSHIRIIDKCPGKPRKKRRRKK